MISMADIFEIMRKTDNFNLEVDSLYKNCMHHIFSPKQLILNRKSHDHNKVKKYELLTKTVFRYFFFSGVSNFTQIKFSFLIILPHSELMLMFKTF